MQDLAYKSKSTLITLSVSATVFVILDCVLAYYHPLIGGILALCALITLISCTCGVIGEITRPNVLITTDSDGSMFVFCDRKWNKIPLSGIRSVSNHSGTLLISSGNRDFVIGNVKQAKFPRFCLTFPADARHNDRRQ